jgi:signal peptidase I
VKRIVAVPGDTFAMCNGDVYINDQKLNEPYAVHTSSANFAPMTIPLDSFFMMGDNRDNSRDSRYFGVVHRNALIGKPMFVYWSYESEPYRGSRTIQEWVEYYGSIAVHFVTRTRWSRTGTVLR